MNIFFVFLIVFFVSLLATYLLWKFPPRFLLDSAGERSLHTGTVPRSGGMAILVAFVMAYGFLDVSFFSPIILVSLGVLCVVSFWDDAVSLSQGWRLLIQLLVCTVMVFCGQLYVVVCDEFPLVVSQVITVLGMVWMINLYNFMDGMDGFASGMGIWGFGTLSLLGYLRGDLDFALINGGLVAAITGFWFWNFPPARIFMGDTGAILLGALAGIMALMGVQREVFPLFVPVIIFSPFWVDATYTLFRRIAHREKIWLAHRSHLYQRLVRSGLGHRFVTLCQYVLMLACSLSVSLPPLVGVDYNTGIPLIWGILYLALILVLEQKLRNKSLNSIQTT